MMRHGRTSVMRVLLVALGVLAASTSGAQGASAPAGARTSEEAVFAGGCFWGVQAVFQRLKGVRTAVSGYAGGVAGDARYEVVSRGTTGHAESVRVSFDPAVIPYATLLRVFFSVAHDPTELNRQGPDVGPQYRSAIFYATEDQRRVARATIEELTRARAHARPIVTQVVPLEAFYPAEAYHQDYLDRHPHDPYIVFHDLPKLASLKRQFPALYVER